MKKKNSKTTTTAKPKGFARSLYDGLISVVKSTKAAIVDYLRVNFKTWQKAQAFLHTVKPADVSRMGINEATWKVYRTTALKLMGKPAANRGGRPSKGGRVSDQVYKAALACYGTAEIALRELKAGHKAGLTVHGKKGEGVFTFKPDASWSDTVRAFVRVLAGSQGIKAATYPAFVGGVVKTLAESVKLPFAVTTASSITRQESDNAETRTVRRMPVAVRK